MVSVSKNNLSVSQGGSVQEIAKARATRKIADAQGQRDNTVRAINRGAANSRKVVQAAGYNLASKAKTPAEKQSVKAALKNTKKANEANIAKAKSTARNSASRTVNYAKSPMGKLENAVSVASEMVRNRARGKK